MDVRSQVIFKRTYSRPLDDTGNNFESWEQTIDRVICHQRWLWERAQGSELEEHQENELDELRQLIRECKVFPAGRVLWLGGTDIGRSRESSLFNCSFLNIETVYDLVDTLWLVKRGSMVSRRASALDAVSSKGWLAAASSMSCSAYAMPSSIF